VLNYKQEKTKQALIAEIERRGFTPHKELVNTKECFIITHWGRQILGLGWLSKLGGV